MFKKNGTNVTRQSNFTGQNNTLFLPITEEDLKAGMEAYKKGRLIQDAFPTLSAEHREFLLTGITPDEWKTHMNPVECETCKRRAADDYTIGCPGCFDHEHAED